MEGNWLSVSQWPEWKYLVVLTGCFSSAAEISLVRFTCSIFIPFIDLCHEFRVALCVCVLVCQLFLCSPSVLLCLWGPREDQWYHLLLKPSAFPCRILIICHGVDHPPMCVFVCASMSLRACLYTQVICLPLWSVQQGCQQSHVKELMLVAWTEIPPGPRTQTLTYTNIQSPAWTQTEGR